HEKMAGARKLLAVAETCEFGISIEKALTVGSSRVSSEQRDSPLL
ncbi:hypothetical protein A2U01_0059602, partial [Trifolium medium]|nr:hypothetical protein [Trifolium medium]